MDVLLRPVQQDVTEIKIPNRALLEPLSPALLGGVASGGGVGGPGPGCEHGPPPSLDAPAGGLGQVAWLGRLAERYAARAGLCKKGDKVRTQIVLPQAKVFSPLTSFKAVILQDPRLVDREHIPGAAWRGDAVAGSMPGEAECNFPGCFLRMTRMNDLAPPPLTCRQQHSADWGQGGRNLIVIHLHKKRVRYLGLTYQ